MNTDSSSSENHEQSKPWAPEPGADRDAAIFQAIGAASVCWDNPRGSGVFDSDQAKAVADGLIRYLDQLGTPLYEADPPQFSVATYVDGRRLAEQPIPDPFASTTVTIDPVDLAAAVTENRPLIVRIIVNGTRAGLRHVMRPIDLSPNDEQPAPPSGHDAAATEGN